jgi:chromosome segregation ATPase
VAQARVNELEGEIEQTKKLLDAKHKKLMEVAMKLSESKQQLAKMRCSC